MDRKGAFQYELPDAGYPDRTKIGQGPSWGDVYDFATDHRTLKELNPGTMFGRALQGVGNVARGEGDTSDAINIGSALAEVTPLGKLGAIGAGAFKAMAMLPKAGKAVDSALDMSHAARMARAKEMGFDTDKVWYHGSNENIPAFNQEMSLEDGSTFFSSHPEVASDFALYRRGYDGGNVTPSHINGEYFEVRGDGRPIRAVERDFDNGVLNGEPFHSKKYGDTVMDHARRGGYAGVVFRDVVDDVGGPNIPRTSDVMAVFDPSRIRSVNAAFDPAKKNSSDLLASAVPGAVVAGGALGAFGLQPQTDEELY